MNVPTNISTLVASANVARTGQNAPRQQRQPSPFENLTIGQHLRLQVLRELEQHRYEVTFGGRRHVVESRVPLAPGSEVTAQVEAKGDKLELRYLEAQPGTRENSADAYAQALNLPQSTDDAGAAPPWLAALANQFKVTLDAPARAAIERAVAKAGNPDLMSRGGLFLQKLLRKVDSQDLEALYRTLSPHDESRSAVALTRVPIGLDDLSGPEDVAATLADALDAAPSANTSAQIPDIGDQANSDAGADSDGERAARLLNVQDEGSVAWRFGTLPLLVGGQLIELDLVMFRERDAQPRRGTLRRLVMTLDTTHFGRVHVEARAVDSRLTVTLSAPTRDAVDVLSAYGSDVRSAIERLGWSVDDLRYELSAPHAGAAQSVVQHVLSAGTVDQEM
jgi:hypothetical protein